MYSCEIRARTAFCFNPSRTAMKINRFKMNTHDLRQRYNFEAARSQYLDSMQVQCEYTLACLLSTTMFQRSVAIILVRRRNYSFRQSSCHPESNHTTTAWELFYQRKAASSTWDTQRKHHCCENTLLRQVYTRSKAAIPLCGHQH